MRPRSGQGNPVIALLMFLALYFVTVLMIVKLAVFPVPDTLARGPWMITIALTTLWGILASKSSVAGWFDVISAVFCFCGASFVWWRFIVITPMEFMIEGSSKSIFAFRGGLASQLLFLLVIGFLLLTISFVRYWYLRYKLDESDETLDADGPSEGIWWPLP